MAKEITLEELASMGSNKRSNVLPTSNSSLKKATPVSTSDLAKDIAQKHPEAQKQVVEEDSPLVANAFASLNETLAKKQDFIENTMMPIVEENAREIAIERELAEMESDENTIVELDNSAKDDIKFIENSIIADEDYVSKENVTEREFVFEKDREPEPVKDNIVTIKPKDDNTGSLEEMLNDLTDDDDDYDDESDPVEEETPEEIRSRFKNSLSNIKIVQNKVDLSSFTISTKPISVSTALNSVKTSTKKCADHPLIHTGRNMRFMECSGPELDALKRTMDSSNNMNNIIATLKFVYAHVVDGNKKSFEAWCKSIRVEDLESLYYGLYKACYSSANMIAVSDDDQTKGCKKTSLVSANIKDMIKFTDDESKELYDKLYDMDTTDPNTTIKSNLLQISDDFAISYTSPTLYSTFIQYASLKPEITNKYYDYLDTMAYINELYRVDNETNRLIPISIKTVENNFNKTIINKLKTYIEILKTLNADQYNVMSAKLHNLVNEVKISYVYPEVTCPECGNVIPEKPIESMLSLLFTRAQLVQVKSL